jgi:hypothetical protein
MYKRPYIINYSNKFLHSNVDNNMMKEIYCSCGKTYSLSSDNCDRLNRLCCGVNDDGSGGGHGYTTISTQLMITAKRQYDLLEEQRLWTQRAEIQDPNEALELEREIDQNNDLIKFLFSKCNNQDVIEEFIEFESDYLQDDDSCVICGCSCSYETGNYHPECLQELDLNIT